MPRVNRPSWVRLVLLIALIKAAVGLAGFALHPPQDVNGYPSILYLGYLVSFGAGAALLLVGGREDHRAVALGGFLLVSATAFANGPVENLARFVQEPWHGPLALLLALQPDMFLAYFLWRFVRDYPQVPVSARARRLIRRTVRGSAWVGVVLFLMGIAAFLWRPEIGRLPRALRVPLERLDPANEAGIAYNVLIPLGLAAFATMIWKARRAMGSEHRRARLFIQSVCLLLSPIFTITLLFIFVSAFAEAAGPESSLKPAILWVGSVPAWMFPCATAYAALVHRVLDLRLIARKALQYALARYSTLLLAAVPSLAVVWSVYKHRNSTVAELVASPWLLLIAAGVVMALVALRYRARLLEAIDRRFFREQYDARQILTLLVQRIRSTHEVGELAELLCRGIDSALHLESIAVLVEDARSGALVDPRSRARRLDATSPLAQLVGNASDALDVDLEKPHSPLGSLPEADRHWLVDAGFRLIVPILARDGSLLGLIGLGEKKSGLPFLREDLKLLYDIASSAALGLELELKHTSAPSHPYERRPFTPLAPTDPAELALEHAKECANCGTLYLPYMVFCGTCSRKLDVALVPYVLPGKFRFERRLGVGGMGVVYQGVDLALGRAMAAKTLRRVSPEDAMRLRREARTAAAVSHPHLAGIYGVETWQGTPMLILEYMEGGTLGQRLEQGALPALTTVDLGIAIAAALERLHAADILHRDVKPSNIGFTREDVPKLMDLGIARVMWDSRRERPGVDGKIYGEDGESRPTPTFLLDDDPTALTGTHQLVGTLSYLSPEALAGSRPNPTFDLWGLCLVLFECLIGRKLFVGANAKQVMARIQLGRIPDLEQTHPGADPVLADFFRSTLHRSLARRPATARELRARLEAVRSHLAALAEGPLG